MPTKVCLVKAMVFPVVTYGCESWTIKKAKCWRIDAFKLWCWRTLESPLDRKEIKPAYPKRNQPWVLIGRTDAEDPILWPPDVNSELIGKDPHARKDWGQEEKGAREDEMVGWYRWLNEPEFEQALGDGEGQGSLVWCSPWGCKESDTTKRLNIKQQASVTYHTIKILCLKEDSVSPDSGGIYFLKKLFPYHGWKTGSK